MRTALIASFSLCWVAGMAFAQTGTQPKLPQSTPPPAASPAPGAKKGKIDPGTEKRPEGPHGGDALGSCLEMWEPSTHMTREQWARACRRVAERLKDLTVK